MQVELVGGPEAGRTVEIPDRLDAGHILVDPVRRAGQPEHEVALPGDWGGLLRAQGQHWPLYAVRPERPGHLFWVAFLGPGHP